MYSVLAWAFVTTIGYQIAIWTPSIIIRNFEMDTADVGLILGLTFIVGGIPGPILGGILSDKLSKYDARWRAWVPAIGAIGCLPLYYLALTADSMTVFLAFFVIGYFLFLFQNGPSIAIIQTATKSGERAMAFAFALLFNNVFGQAIGPPIVGALSDRLEPQYGVQSLNIATLAVCIVAGFLAFGFYLAAASAIREQEEQIAAAEASA